MSLNHFTDPEIYNPWMNINCNSITANEVDIKDLKLDKLTIVETETSTIQGSLTSGTPLLEITNTSPTASLFGAGLSVSNSTGETIKILSQNTSGDQAIWADGRLNVLTRTAPGTITLSPNGTLSLTALDTGVNISGTVSASAQPYIELNLAAPKSITSNTDTKLSDMSTTSSVGTQITYNSVTGLFTVSLTGIYNIGYSVTWLSAAGGSRAAYVNPSGGSVAFAYSGHDNVSTGIASNTGSLPLRLAGASQFSINVIQTSGSPLTITEAHITVTKLS